MFRRRTFEFAGLTNSTAIVIPLSRISIAGETQGTLLMRVHEQQLLSGDRLTIRLRRTLCSPEDINEDFNDAATLASLAVGVTTPAPTLLRASVAVFSAEQLLVEIECAKGNLGPNNLATVSAELILKE